jgi:hypothetical protein
MVVCGPMPSESAIRIEDFASLVERMARFNLERSVCQEL